MCYHCVGEWAEQVWACLYPSYGLGWPCDSPCRTKTTSAYTSGPVFTSLSLSSWPLWRLQDWVSEERVSDRQRIVRQKKLVKLRWHTCWPVRTDEKSEHSIVNWSEPQVSRERGQAQPTKKTPVLTSKAPKKSVATTSLASKSIPKSHFIINYSLADCIWWPSFRRFSLTKKKLQNKKEKRKKKRIHTYFTRLERNGEIVAVFVIVVRRFDIRLCSGVRIIRVIIKEKVYVRSKYVLHAVLLLHNVSFFSPWFFPQQNVFRFLNLTQFIWFLLNFD